MAPVLHPVIGNSYSQVFESRWYNGDANLAITVIEILIKSEIMAPATRRKTGTSRGSCMVELFSILFV